jgi:phosphotransferase system enzyme I (PtsP)
LLRDLRDVLGNYADPERRLEMVVKTIAQGMGTPVCSIYIKRPGEVLELFATYGLSQQAVHQTRLRIGEGLVGLVTQTAAPVIAADAWQHPNFVYRPETAEEQYKSFCGVPILLGGRVIGVLTIQNAQRRDFAGEDVEQLETAAILLGYVLFSGDLIKNIDPTADEGTASVITRLPGLRINSGLAIGRAVMYNSAPRITRMLSDQPEAERQRLRAAIRTMQGDINAKIHEARENLNDEASPALVEPLEILETYSLFTRDQSWLNRMYESIDSGLSAEAAVQKVHNETRARLNLTHDPYLRARMADIEDLTARLLQHLLGEQGFLQKHIMDQDFIVVARDLGPAALLDFDRRYLRGLLLEEGAQTAHVAVVARALQIPVVGKIAEAMRRIEAGDRIIVDGDRAEVYLRPGEEIVQTAQAQIAAKAKLRAVYEAAKHLPSITADGVPIDLMVNAGLPVDVEQLAATNAHGIGLFRTEIAFMTYGDVPSVTEQTEFYRQILDAAGDKPVVFRTIDVGGDKVLASMPISREENPAMGWRGLRLALDFPSLLRQQLRAMLRAASGRRLHVMFPMVASATELARAKALVTMEMDLMRANGETLPSHVATGAMIEVPALLWQLPAVLAQVDFLSVGSNDLLQFIFASDRGGSRTASRYDSLSPSFLRLLRQLSLDCHKANIPLTVCGEMAAKPLDAMVLAALGIHRLSMAAVSIGPIRSVIRQMRMAPWVSIINNRLEHGKEDSLRPLLNGFARDQGIELPS